MTSHSCRESMWYFILYTWWWYTFFVRHGKILYKSDVLFLFDSSVRLLMSWCCSFRSSNFFLLSPFLNLFYYIYVVAVRIVFYYIYNARVLRVERDDSDESQLEVVQKYKEQKNQKEYNRKSLFNCFFLFVRRKF
jgi:hypothetical protein